MNILLGKGHKNKTKKRMKDFAKLVILNARKMVLTFFYDGID